MRRPSALAALALSCLLLAAPVSHAQGPHPENIQIGLSTDEVSITASFSGTSLTIFGALENAGVTRDSGTRYDVVVVLEGPSSPVVVRKKNRVLGVWVNTEAETFFDVPASYSVATTRPPEEITDAESYRRLALGPDHMRLRGSNREGDPARQAEFSGALREGKKARGLYSEHIGGVQFLSPNLFRARLMLAPDVPVGAHRARAFLFRNGVFIDETSAPLDIRKAGVEQRIFEAAHGQSFFYGLAAVLVAVLTGWVGRLLFRRET